ncbi:MAG: hypothetical protein ACE5HI_10260 [bacterium]
MNLRRINKNYFKVKILLNGGITKCLNVRYKHRPIKNETGGLSITFIFFMILMFATLGVVSYSVMIVDSRISVKYMQGIQAQYLAEAGIEYGIKRIFQGQSAPYTESVSLSGGYFDIAVVNQDTVLSLTSTGGVNDAQKGIQVLISYRLPIGDLAIYSTGEVSNVTTLDESGDPDPSLLVDNADSLPDMDNQALIDMATSQGHVETGSEFNPTHGYPNFNFYFSGSTPNVTYVQGDMRVQGGRTVYGIYMVEGDIVLDGSSRVEGVLYMVDPDNIVIHGGGSPTQSSVTGGIVANGDVDGTGNHITVHYNPEYMQKFGNYENTNNSSEILIWREL